ncbi:MAG TPA: hypothetical protein DCY59_11245, partial [Micrococcaceae bacterium]|nr:hypothetical protein [Micrococcaceae bacterium]
DFGHCIRALAAYATETHADGSFVKRTPNVYPEHGRHWTGTAPEGHEAPKAKPCGDHDTEPAHNCRSCLADVKVGDRPENMIGIRTTPTVTPGRSPRPSSTRKTQALTHDGDSKHQLPTEEPLDANETASYEPGRTFPHSTPTEPGASA